jgi:hypothetical protein
MISAQFLQDAYRGAGRCAAIQLLAPIISTTLQRCSSTGKQPVLSVVSADGAGEAVKVRLIRYILCCKKRHAFDIVPGHYVCKNCENWLTDAD